MCSVASTRPTCMPNRPGDILRDTFALEQARTFFAGAQGH